MMMWSNQLLAKKVRSVMHYVPKWLHEYLETKHAGRSLSRACFRNGEIRAISDEMVKFSETVRQRRFRAVTLFRLKFHRFGEIKRYGVMIRVAIRKNPPTSKKPSICWAFSIFSMTHIRPEVIFKWEIFTIRSVSLKSAVESQYLQLCEKTVKS
jgi:hypothetical protein